MHPQKTQNTKPQNDSLLDIEYINAAAPGIPLAVYYAMQYSILDWISAVNDNPAPELVHSVSYVARRLSFGIAVRYDWCICAR